MVLVLITEIKRATWEFAWDYALHSSVYLGTSTPSAPPFLTDLTLK